MTDQFAFSSDGQPESEAFAAYARLYAQGADVFRTSGPFVARVKAVRMDGIILYDRTLNGVGHARGDRVQSDGFDHFALHMVLGGVLRGSPASRFDVARTGDLLLVDTTQPARTEANDLHVITMSVARPIIAAAAGGTQGLHGRVVPAPRSLLFRDFLLSVRDNIAALPIESLPGVKRAFMELLGVTLDVTGSSGSQRAEFGQREAAVRYILANLTDRNLNAECVAQALGRSRSSLYRLFEDQGGVAQFIMSRRLGAVREALEAGSIEPLFVLAERYGFTNESHLNRRFNQAFGQPAGAFRRSVLQHANDSPDASARRWAGWMAEVE